MHALQDRGATNHAGKSVFAAYCGARFAGERQSYRRSVLRRFSFEACGDVRFFTFGLYELYWFYKNWQAIKLREKENISPFWRAFFGYFFCYALFSEIGEWQQEIGKGKMPAGWLACGWIIANLTWRLPDPFWLISTASVLFLVPVQKVVNEINRIEAPDHVPNDKIRGVNWIAILAGGLVLALVLVGLYVPGDSA
jgi:hypothetical protein